MRRRCCGAGVGAGVEMKDGGKKKQVKKSGSIEENGKGREENSKGRTESRLTGIFWVLCTAVFLFLFAASFLRTGFFSFDLEDEYVYFKHDSYGWNLMWLAAVSLFAAVSVKLFCKAEEKCRINMTAAAVIAAVVMAGFSLYWVNAAQTAPVADQEYICVFASDFNRKYYLGLLKGKYVGYYRHQLGLVTIMRLVFFLYGDGNYMAFQNISAMLTAVILLSGYGIVKLVSDDNKPAELFYLILMLGCYPLYGYVTFVYGEIGSTAFIMLAAWLLLWYLRSPAWWKLLYLAVSVGLAVQFRANTVILAVAFLIVAVVKLLSKPDRRSAAAGAAVLLGVLGSYFLLNLGYRDIIPEDSKNMPAALTLALGANDDRLPGWNNDYDIQTYMKYDWEPEPAAKEAWEYVGNFIKKCVQNPGYAVKFYYEKLGSQWNAPMYQVLQMNSKVTGEQKWPLTRLYSREGAKEAESYMNIYQLVVYGAVLFLLCARRKTWKQVDRYILLIGVFGGFLFSALWEAKTRYVVPYLYMMLPYAGIGLADWGEQTGKLYETLRRRCHGDRK